MQPFPIFCRGHSGGRLLCEAYIRNGIRMGRVAPDRKDAGYFSDRNPVMRYLMMQAFRYPWADEIEQEELRALMRHCVRSFHKGQIDGEHPFGWKLGVSIFTLPLVLDAFPGARAVHLIRDGRDVMLSRLNARLAHLADPFNRLVVFGDAKQDRFNGLSLSQEVVEHYRTALEMQHWVTAVRYGLRGRAYPDRYLEVRYEALCADPAGTCQRVFDFLGVPFLDSTRSWLQASVHQNRIGKWHDLTEQEMALPLNIGGSMLRELGYI